MATENANRPMDRPLSVTDGRATFTVMEGGWIQCAYEVGPNGYWRSYEDMMADRDLATKLGRKIRSRRG